MPRLILTTWQGAYLSAGEQQAGLREHTGAQFGSRADSVRWILLNKMMLAPRALVVLGSVPDESPIRLNSRVPINQPRRRCYFSSVKNLLLTLTVCPFCAASTRICPNTCSALPSWVRVRISSGLLSVTASRRLGRADPGPLCCI